MKNHISESELIVQRRRQIVVAAVKLFAKQGFYTTTMQDIATEAGVSIGLIYHYFKDKNDVLYLSLLDVLDSYEHEIPKALATVTDPLQRVLVAIKAYCRIADERSTETVLAYRSTKSLPKINRKAIMDAELRTNQLIADCVQQCVDEGIFDPISVPLITYQLVMQAHTWALKRWALGEQFTLDKYIEQATHSIIRGQLSSKGKRRFKKLLEA